MRRMLPINRARQSGFTLIEMLIIAPIVILAIGGFVALMVNMVGEVLVTREESSLAFETQQALDRIEQDVRLSTQFLVTSGAQTSPQGSDDNAAAFSNASNALLLSTLATDKNPADVSRGLVYIANQPNPCGGDQRYNRVLLTKVFYFIKSGSLWRRTVVPAWNTNSAETADANTVCTAPWQVNSCSPGYTNTTQCKTNDEKIMDNITALNVQYFADAGGTTPLTAAEATSSGSINVTINSQKTVSGGNVVTDSGNVRVSKLNDIDTTQLPPATPTVSSNISSPNTAEFTWQAVPTATAYQVGYQINGGPWVTQTVDAATLNYTVSANRNDSISFRVASFNNAGSSAYATVSATIPSWYGLQFTSPWVNYTNNTNYHTAGFTKTSNGRVFLKGLIEISPTAGAVTNSTIGRLPEGYRPEGKLVFQTVTSPNVAARVDIEADGDIIAVTGDGSWLSLDSISFLPASQPYVWNNVTYNASASPIWSNWGSPYENVRITRDTIGRVNLQGLARAGNNTSNTTIATPPSTAYNPTKSLHFPAGANGFGEFWVWSDGDIVKRGPQTSSYLGLNTIYYPSTLGTWTSITPISPWVNYNDAAGSYPQLACTKASDGVVTIRGLIKSGGVTNVTAAKLPAACTPPDKQTAMVAASYDDVGRVDIMSNGDLIIRDGATNWFALNMSYVAD